MNDFKDCMAGSGGVEPNFNDMQVLSRAHAFARSHSNRTVPCILKGPVPEPSVFVCAFDCREKEMARLFLWLGMS